MCDKGGLKVDMTQRIEWIEKAFRKVVIEAAELTISKRRESRKRKLSDVRDSN